MAAQHGFYAGACGTPFTFCHVEWPWYNFLSSGIVRFVQGGVVKTFPYVPLFDMALSKRNSKPITIGDAEFRWAVAARSQADTEMVTVVVQPPDNGCRLAVTVPCRDYWLNIQSPPAPSYNIHAITPGFVGRLIDDARSLGWQPSSADPQFTVDCVLAEARGDDGEPPHACWQCPDCEQSYSEEIEFGEQPPLMSSCGRSKHHSGGRSTNVILFW
ncbi:MAG: hypothetical protein Aurels2KO_55130 [Aureliella sp.]